MELQVLEYESANIQKKIWHALFFAHPFNFLFSFRMFNTDIISDILIPYKFLHMTAKLTTSPLWIPIKIKIFMI